MTINVNRKLPPYHLRLIPDNRQSDGNSPVHVGSIVVAREGQTEPLQTIEVESYSSADLFLSTFRVEDINFDGYLDIAATHSHGAKWMSFNYWLFNPATGKFITNRLTKQLRQLGWNEMTLSPRERTIRVTHLNLGEGVLVGETYKVENNRLRVIEVERTVKAGKGKDKDGFDKLVVRRFKPTAKDRRNLPPSGNP